MPINLQQHKAEQNVNLQQHKAEQNVNLQQHKAEQNVNLQQHKAEQNVNLQQHKAEQNVNLQQHKAEQNILLAKMISTNHQSEIINKKHQGGILKNQQDCDTSIFFVRMRLFLLTLDKIDILCSFFSCRNFE